MTFIAYCIVSSSFPPGNPFHKRVSAGLALVTPGTISKPTSPFPHRQVSNHLRLSSIMDIGAWFATIWANCNFDCGFYEKIDPARTYHLVMGNMNIGKVQKFSQFWILGHLLTSAIKVVSRGYKTYALC
jgi:hypothetical protein